MATYIHSKMTNNANKGHRRFGASRTKKSSRNGGRGTTRFIDGLRTRNRSLGVQASATDVLRYSTFSYGNAFTVNVPKTAGGTGTTVTIVAYDGASGLGTPAANTIRFNGRGSGTEPRDNLILAINGTADSTKAVFGNGSDTLSAANVVGAGIQGLTAAAGSTNYLNLTASAVSAGGNNITVTQTVGGTTIVITAQLSSNKLTGGTEDDVKTAERLFSANLPYGAAKGTSYTGTTIGRTNTSVGTKDLIRDSAA